MGRLKLGSKIKVVSRIEFGFFGKLSDVPITSVFKSSDYLINNIINFSFEASRKWEIRLFQKKIFLHIKVLLKARSLEYEWRIKKYLDNLSTPNVSTSQPTSSSFQLHKAKFLWFQQKTWAAAGAILRNSFGFYVKVCTYNLGSTPNILVTERIGLHNSILMFLERATNIII